MSAREDVLVGRTEHGDRVYVSARLTERIGGHTVEHEEAGEYLEFAMTGLVVGKGRRIENAYSAGQCLDVLLELTQLEPGFTVGSVADMHTTWRRWHLNGMKAGCAHQGKPVMRKNPRYGYREVDLDATPSCPVTGYRYGSAWLSEQLPPEIFLTVEEFIATGTWIPRKEG